MLQTLQEYLNMQTRLYCIKYVLICIHFQKWIWNIYQIMSMQVLVSFGWNVRVKSFLWRAFLSSFHKSETSNHKKTPFFQVMIDIWANLLYETWKVWCKCYWRKEHSRKEKKRMWLIDTRMKPPRVQDNIRTVIVLNEQIRHYVVELLATLRWGK